ncbi:MAG: 4Fe-4S dicluster domain-containing protein [Dehalococcoidia bacterium]|jgi:heterodisulfide reductase subunit C
MISAQNTIRPRPHTTYRSFVEAHIRQSIAQCYQCGKCTAGCPVAYTMELTPRRVIRALQLGLENELENSSTMWICLSCLTCSARCPREINIAGVMEALRLATIGKKPTPDQKKFRLFHDLFIMSFQFSGRAYELGLGMAYNVMSGQFLNMASIIPGMLRRGKLAFLPHKSRGSETQHIFQRLEGQNKAMNQAEAGTK